VSVTLFLFSTRENARLYTHDGKDYETLPRRQADLRHRETPGVAGFLYLGTGQLAKTILDGDL
jgi:hypothetical protein